ncbi:MAG TPA: hypothetical protein VFW39_11470 [Sphingomicrobium sp.]|nr:hypothetical protein [Sphingomicrobium sp.]
MPTALSRDFDGAILLHRVTGADFTFIAPPARRLIRWTGWVLRNYVTASLILVAIIAALMFGVRGAWRALRRKVRSVRRSTSTPSTA